MKNCDEVSIPVKENVTCDLDVLCSDDGSLLLNRVPFRIIRNKIYMPCPRKQRLKKVIEAVMRRRGLWERSLEAEIPVVWEKYGDLLLFNGDRCFKNLAWSVAGPELWTNVCAVLNGNRVGLKGHISSDGFRTPNVRLVWGELSWVDCVDNGIRYSWDVTKTMFSAGNAPERHRLARFRCDGEVVVDMYAGIGYFTLPYLVHARARMVHACEWNPDAVIALRKNLIQNNVSERCIIHEGDNQKVQLHNIADRVNLGLLPSCEASWQTACKVLKSTGGVLHIHGNVTSGIDKTDTGTDLYNHSFETAELALCLECRPILIHALSKKFLHETCKQSFSFDGDELIIGNSYVSWKKVEWKAWALHASHSICSILSEVYEIVWKVSVLHLHRVKSYAPHIDHLVLDLSCEPCV
ncbi:tRNA wybutosine-synthesizing protein 2 homolog isoform X3 [Cryptotermes secundus]|nr:tRNA wybutosine-synthesizing protein 2 homolog isoform X3 [Cryptotermes secundus]